MRTMTTLLLALSLSFAFAQENNALTCGDGIDNDGDGMIDCADSDCSNLTNDGCETCGEGITFADVIISFESGCPDNADLLPESSLGVADYIEGELDTHTSLGQGGVLKLGFTNNILTNSGNTDDDVFIFEVGVLVENCTLAFRPANSFTETQLQAAGIVDANNDGFYEFGSVGGSTAGFDIDEILVDYIAGVLLFDAIEITDVDDGNCAGDTPGADIDAVCALSSSQPLSVSDILNQSFNVYPNPTNGKVSITFDNFKENVKVSVTNVFGQIVYSNYEKNVLDFTFSFESVAGIYFVALEVDGTYLTKRIIKE